MDTSQSSIMASNEKTCTHVACASRVLVIIPLSALLATNGFIKGVVVFQVDWGMLLISAAGGVWMVTLLR